MGEVKAGLARRDGLRMERKPLVVLVMEICPMTLTTNAVTRAPSGPAATLTLAGATDPTR